MCGIPVFHITFGTLCTQMARYASSQRAQVNARHLHFRMLQSYWCTQHMTPQQTDALASSLTQAITAHDLSGMSAAKAHNFCESLCFLKVATFDGSLYNAEFTCSHQRPSGSGIFRTTAAHRYCRLRAVKARHNVMQVQVQVKSMTTSDTDASPGSAGQHILRDILLDPTMQETRQQDYTIQQG